VVIRVSPVEFYHRELRVVQTVHPFIAEVLAILPDFFKTTDNEPLQVEFISNSEIHGHVKFVVVGLEWQSVAATVQRL